jgi:hypothetical protein
MSPVIDDEDVSPSADGKPMAETQVHLALVASRYGKLCQQIDLYEKRIAELEAELARLKGLPKGKKPG